MVTSLDRIVASTSGMAGALYVLAALVLWSMIVFRKEVATVVYDRAIAWSAMAALFLAITAGRLRWVLWSDIAWVFVLSTLAIMLAGLVSVRTMTREKFGNVPLLVFVAVIFTAGTSLWLWG